MSIPQLTVKLILLVFIIPVFLFTTLNPLLTHKALDIWLPPSWTTKPQIVFLKITELFPTLILLKSSLQHPLVRVSQSLRNSPPGLFNFLFSCLYFLSSDHSFLFLWCLSLLYILNVDVSKNQTYNLFFPPLLYMASLDTLIFYPDFNNNFPRNTSEIFLSLAQLLGKTLCHYLEKLNICMLYDLAIPLLGISSKVTLIHICQETHEKMFIVSVHNSKKNRKSSCPRTIDKLCIFTQCYTVPMIFSYT